MFYSMIKDQSSLPKTLSTLLHSIIKFEILDKINKNEYKNNKK